jgi:hypothetical protein
MYASRKGWPELCLGSGWHFGCQFIVLASPKAPNPAQPDPSIFWGLFRGQVLDSIHESRLGEEEAHAFVYMMGFLFVYVFVFF